jgi:hypothetical protein
MLKMDILETFITRMKRLNINIELVVNYPWVYLNKINGKYVTEKFRSEHGFTIAFLPIKKEGKMEFTNISEIFSLIRKYGKI